MKKTIPFCILVAVLFHCCNNNKTNTQNKKDTMVKKIDTVVKGIFLPATPIHFDSTRLTGFFKSFPDLKQYEKDYTDFYRARNYSYAWFDSKGIVEQASVLWSNITDSNNLTKNFSIPYADKISSLVQQEGNSKMADGEKTEAELLITGAYLHYAYNNWAGLGKNQTDRMEWFLPRKQMNYTGLLEEAAKGKSLSETEQSAVFNQYVKLRDALVLYKSLAEKDSTRPVASLTKNGRIKPGDSSLTISLIKNKLAFLYSDKALADGSNIYTASIADAVNKFKRTHGLKSDSIINNEMIQELNVPLKKRIDQIVVNMERFRWIPANFSYDEFIVVNIPDFMLRYYENKKEVWTCNVVVGSPMTKTVIFSGMMQYVVMSPYWNVPTSIINKEVKPGMQRNKNYLANHNMEWNGGNVRQKPGRNNSLGLVKFLFPNSNNIYLHDTPSKSLFGEDQRAFSHGCIRVAKPRDLAIRILRQDSTWTPAKIDQAMNGGKEVYVTLKKKIPVYIGYFTAFFDKDGDLNFRKDVYNRDGRVLEMLTK